MRSTAVLTASLLAVATACTSDPGTMATGPALRTSSLERDGNEHEGAVYVMSNDVATNAILVYPRAGNGQLSAPTAVPTGGRGTGAGLGNQYGLVLEDDMLFAVNAGSNEISSFTLDEATPRLADRVASGGDEPVSIAVHDKLVYVLNDGATANITGFRVNPHGRLQRIEGSTRPRSAPAGAVDGAEIRFSPDGRTLVVTEKAANLVVSYPVLPNGRTGTPRITTSSGATPFGFDFSPAGALVVSEAAGGAAGKSTMSSYRVDRGSNVSVITGALPTGETAACWTVVSSDGRTAYTANTGGRSISTFAVSGTGALTLLNGKAALTGAGTSPGDLDLSPDDRFLYVRSNGTGSVFVYATGANGSITQIQQMMGLPAGTNGIAVR